MDEFDITSTLIRKLVALANLDSQGRSHKPTKSVYIIEVENLDRKNNWDYYVGYTGKNVEERYKEHLIGYKSWREFKAGRSRPKGLAFDLMAEFPKFYTVSAAKEAEGLVARALRDSEYEVYSDMIDQV